IRRGGHFNNTLATIIMCSIVAVNLSNNRKILSHTFELFILSFPYKRESIHFIWVEITGY
ncbi:MAG: hypothetical protein Q8M94_05120, partial [Ignavibacteria bacterium]|nr:hypothetical protein [Ignavibacteria bacterium]